MNENLEKDNDKKIKFISFNNYKVSEGILKLIDPNNPPKLNNVIKRFLILSPAVKAGLEPESQISDFEKEREIAKYVWKVIHKKTQKVYILKVIKKYEILEKKSA